jgi:hypothetical protein
LFTTVLALILSLTGIGAGAQDIDLQLDGGAFRVIGWNAPSSPPAQGWSSVFAVYAGTGDIPPLIGSYAVESGNLVFRPKYPFAPGVKYRAVFHRPGGAPIEKIFDGPPKAVSSTARVQGVYPSAAVLPANLLRLYISFSEPMSRGEASSRLHLLDASGKALPGVFLAGEELWDPAGTRLTMTFDPGRIKRGLTSNMAMGSPIQPGKTYTLVIDREWRDARGLPMIEGARKSFRGGLAQRTPPDPKTWRISPPKAGTLDALVVDFPAPMNYALLQRMLQVSAGRNSVAGAVSTAHEETEWRFTPQSRWRPGQYQLVTDTAIEDLAGNRIGLPFDVDVFDHVTEHITARTMSLPFAIR